MSETATDRLPIPNEALSVARDDLYEAFWHGKNELGYDVEHYARGTVQAISAPVVAAVLREIATTAEQQYEGAHRWQYAERLRNYATALDGADA